MNKLIPLLVAAALGLAACQTTPTLMVYGPAAGPTAPGYAETSIEQGRWRVTYRGPSGAEPRQVWDFAMRRAAELTLREGYDWFRITERYGEGGEEPDGRHVGFSVGAGFGLGVESGLGVHVDSPRAISRTIEILMGRGPAPRDPDVFDARQIRRAAGQLT